MGEGEGEGEVVVSRGGWGGRGVHTDVSRNRSEQLATHCMKDESGMNSGKGRGEGGLTAFSLSVKSFPGLETHLSQHSSVILERMA